MPRKSTTRRQQPSNPFDPKKTALGKLFWFWNAYDEEEMLLESWHDSTVRVSQPTGNPLYDSFLDTWGKGRWDAVRKPGRVPWSKMTYFQTLGVVSHRLREQCRKVLDKFLVRKGRGFKIPPQLKPGVNPAQAEREAKDGVGRLLAAFNDPEIPSLQEIDEKVKKVLRGRRARNNIYLNALLKMMLIETDCFRIQRRFLQKGVPLP
jgi:hypothetical protein